ARSPGAARETRRRGGRGRLAARERGVRGGASAPTIENIQRRAGLQEPAGAEAELVGIDNEAVRGVKREVATPAPPPSRPSAPLRSPEPHPLLSRCSRPHFPCSPGSSRSRPRPPTY